MVDVFKNPVKKFDGKLFKARKWTLGRESAHEWARQYRKSGYLARVVKGIVMMPGVATQYPEGLGGRAVKQRVQRPSEAYIIYLRRK